MKVIPDERIAGFVPSASELKFILRDGRTLSVPRDWFPRLQAATPEQLERFEITGHGFVVRWPELDEDLEISGLLLGNASPELRGSVSPTGEAIRNYREQSGISQAELARQLGVRQATISDWEKGKTTPSPLAAIRLSELIRRAVPATHQDSPPAIERTGSPDNRYDPPSRGSFGTPSGTPRKTAITHDAKSYQFNELGCSMDSKMLERCQVTNFVAQFVPSYLPAKCA